MKTSAFLSACILVVGWAVYGHAAMDVFVSIPPQKWLVSKVGGELVNIKVLVKNGQDPHTFEPSPRQVAALTRAKIWFTMDMEFENQLVRKVREVAPDVQIVDIADAVVTFGQDNNEDADSGRDVEHRDDGHDGHENHDGLDPHVWLSPPNLQVMVEKVARTLAGADFANSDVYNSNLAAVHKDLETLHQDLTAQLKPFEGASFYVFHPSFGHFAHTYGLQQKAVEVGGKSPGPRQLTKLVARARNDKVKVIFVQPQFDPKSASAVASAIGGNVVPLDALAEDVAANLRTMATKIETALSR